MIFNMVRTGTMCEVGFFSLIAACAYRNRSDHPGLDTDDDDDDDRRTDGFWRVCRSRSNKKVPDEFVPLLCLAIEPFLPTKLSFYAPFRRGGTCFVSLTTSERRAGWPQSAELKSAAGNYLNIYGLLDDKTPLKLSLFDASFGSKRTMDGIRREGIRKFNQ